MDIFIAGEFEGLASKATLVSTSEAGFSFDSGTLAANALPGLGLV
jgi:hypothetical protein